jgi:hypothetical protein
VISILCPQNLVIAPPFVTLGLLCQSHTGTELLSDTSPLNVAGGQVFFAGAGVSRAAAEADQDPHCDGEGAAAARFAPELLRRNGKVMRPQGWPAIAGA